MPRKLEAASVASLTLEALRRDFDTRLAVDYLTSECGGEFYIFGGAVRDTILERPQVGDLDVMIANGDLRCLEALDRLKVPYGFNSQNHRRYRWNALQIDIFEPKQFFKPFETVQAAVAYFDLRINAFAVHVGSLRLIDPLDGLAALRAFDPGINWPRWTEASPTDVQVLLLRLVRLLHNIPQLRLPRRDAERLITEVIPQVEDEDWTPVQARFPLGRLRFFELFRETIRHSRS